MLPGAEQAGGRQGHFIEQFRGGNAQVAVPVGRAEDALLAGRQDHPRGRQAGAGRVGRAAQAGDAFQPGGVAGRAGGICASCSSCSVVTLIAMLNHPWE